MMEEPSIGVNDFSFGEDDYAPDMYVDLDELWKELDGPGPESNQGSGEESSPTNIIEGLGDSKDSLSPRFEAPSNVTSPLYYSEASDGRTSSSDGFSESAGNSVASGERINPSLQLSLADHSYDLPVQGNDSRNMLQNSAPYIRNNNFSLPNHDDGMFECLAADARPEDLYSKELMEETDLSSYFGQTDDSSFMGGEKTSQDPFFFTSYDAPCLPHSSGHGSIASDDYIMFDIMDDGKNDEDFTKPYNDLIRSECMQPNLKNENSNIFSLNSQLGAFDVHAVKMKPEIQSPNTLSNIYSEVYKNDFKVEKNIDAITSNDIVSRASEVIDDVISRKHYRGIDDPPSTGVIWPSPNYSSVISHRENYIPCIKDDKADIVLGPNRTLLSLGLTSGGAVKSSSVFARDPRSVLRRPSQPVLLPSSSVKAGRYSLKMEKEASKPNDYSLSKSSYQGVQINTLDLSNDDDDDVCILEHLSGPAVPYPTVMNGVTSQFPTARIPDGQMVSGHSRIKPNDERIIYREALQDLSLPKLEATPPDGLLAVPLLKHQRIALFWMVNKETKSDTCCGGILADDQGLGKTVSTIALILKERSPSAKTIKAIDEQIKTETLNLDEDDETSENQHVNERAKPCQVNPFLLDPGKNCLQTKGRPSAGTLIVCPTSVLRQWSEELHNKVTSEANLSVLVYHGSNRTKDPLELAKYDVVVTTFAIVSMEVPKQPIVDEKEDMVGTPFQGYSSSKKRKQLGTSTSKSKKSKKGNEDESPESGPLAKVGWFRVVLDEAQSIKNHRTQVARACWGLRAKRRWCLSGTPIQNSVDDLYSYFRFLRHEPYAAFKTFCEQIKVPIHKSPRIGFKKLQAVLKTIMLRRTKGSLLDGEPIINLPPKTIELTQVDFSEEERDFYRTLEAESQAQFAEYAAKGTVKQNYVNILLMLLRLRQACDHPLLVKRISSKSKMASSINMAKKLPQERQVFLLNCVEGAICGICSDAPEDAIVAACGHVFCNQCICEHMLGDDSNCPTKNCKKHLNTSQIFSISSLSSAISDQPSVENTPNCDDSDRTEASQSCSLNCPQDSSKIKAALDLLLSLAKPDDIVSRMDYDSENLDKNPKKIMGEKAIVFSQWTGMLDLLEACLKSSNIQYRRLDGTMHVTARDKAVKDFNTLPEVTVMIMSLKAASLGLNMVAACRVILLDLWWNPTTEDQAIDRAHRIGQTRPVSVFRLTVKDTVEDRILALQQRKREMVASAFGEDETGGQQTRLTVDDLKYLFGVH